MNIATFLRVLCVFVSLTLSVVAWGDQIPQSLAVTLQQREQHLSSSTFNWQLTDTENHYPLFPPDKIRMMRIQGEKEWEQQFRRWGATKESEIKPAAIANTENMLKNFQGGLVNYSNKWLFERNGASTLVTGTTESLSGLVAAQQQYYDANLVLVAPVSSHQADGRKVTPNDPVVWQAVGDGTRYSSPLITDLGLTPEHFAMLIGINPVTLHGANWQIISTTPSAWVIGTHITEGRFPCAIQVTLDRLRGNATSDIKIQKPEQSRDFHADSFRLYQGMWLPDKIHMTSHAAHFSDIKQNWVLLSITPSKAIQVHLSPLAFVHDYRLLGANLTQKTILNAETGQHHDIVMYQWKGHFPSMSDLENFHQHEHPGEASPDIGQAGASSPLSTASVIGSSLPFAGGVLLLTGGVWMFKQRKAN